MTTKTKLTDRDLYEMYDNFLDEIYPNCQIAGLTYLTSRILKEVDPIVYRCGFNDWLDSEIEAGVIEDLEGAEEYYLA